MSTPQIMEPSACTWCGIAQRPHGRQYADAAGWHAWEQPSQEQILARMKARRLQLAVARAGALPVPVGGERTLDVVEEELTGVNLALWEEIQAYARLRLALASAKRGRGRLRAQVSELEAQRDRRRTRLVALDADALNVRGALSPMGEDRKVPFPLGPTLLPAVEWLIARVAELESDLATANGVLDDTAKAWRADASCPCPPSDQPGPHQLGCPQAEVPVSERPVNELTATFMPVAALREVPSGETDPGRRAAWRMLDREERHDSPLRHDYRVGHDLPELGGGA